MNPTPTPQCVRLGCVGHRRLADPAAIAVAAAALMQQLAAGMAHLSARWVAVSPAARGADRILTRAAMTHLHAALHIISPFAIDEYRLDFDTPDDLAEFDELHAAAGRVSECQPDQPRPASAANRMPRYLAAGRAVVDAADLIAAVWDHNATASSGTADAALYALQLGRPVLCIHPDDPAAPAHRLIATPAPPGAHPRLHIKSRPLPDTPDDLIPDLIHRR